MRCGLHYWLRLRPLLRQQDLQTQKFVVGLFRLGNYTKYIYILVILPEKLVQLLLYRQFPKQNFYIVSVYVLVPNLYANNYLEEHSIIVSNKFYCLIRLMSWSGGVE